MIGHPYPSYRPSGVEWLGDIPEHWNVQRLGTVLIETVGGGTPDTSNEAFWADKDDPALSWVTISDMSAGGEITTTAKKVTSLGRTAARLRPLPSGTIIYSMYASVGAVARLATTAATNQAILGLIPGAMLKSSFLYWWLTGIRTAVLAQTRDNTQSNLNAETVRMIPVVLPPIAEQRTIADYLDTETARIDTLISKKRRLIELLQERWGVWVRNQLASLPNPALPLKRHWRVIDCKHRTPTYVEEGYPVVSPGDATPGRLDLRRAHRFVDESDYNDLASGFRQPKRGDIVYSRNASIGIASYVDTDEPFCMGQDVCLIQSNDMDQLFLMYALNSIGLDQLETQKIGSTFDRVNISQILEIRVPVPDPSEQQKLGRRFDLAASRRSRAQGTLEQQIDLLQEYRTTLITATVTGQVSVEA